MELIIIVTSNIEKAMLDLTKILLVRKRELNLC